LQLVPAAALVFCWEPPSRSPGLRLLCLPVRRPSPPAMGTHKESAVKHALVALLPASRGACACERERESCCLVLGAGFGFVGAKLCQTSLPDIYATLFLFLHSRRAFHNPAFGQDVFVEDPKRPSVSAPQNFQKKQTGGACLRARACVCVCVCVCACVCVVVEEGDKAFATARGVANFSVPSVRATLTGGRCCSCW